MLNYYRPIDIKEMITFIKDNFCAPQNTDNKTYTKPRIEYIDLAKGVCIILVVILHLDIQSFDLPGLRILRMPLYFFLSGLFFKQYDNFHTFLEKKVNNLIIPCIFFEICYIIHKLLNGTFPIANIIPHLCLIEITNGPLWFLISLFTINIIYYCIVKLGREWITLLSILICAISGYVLHLHNYNPWYIGSSLSAAPLFYFGHFFKRRQLLPHSLTSGMSNISKWIILTLSVTVFAGIIILSQIFDLPQLHLLDNIFLGNPILFYIISILSITSFITICSIIRWIPVISYFGRYSIITLGIHQIIHFFYTFPIYWITGHTPENYQNLTLTLIACWLSIPIFKKYFPYVTAQKNMFDWIRKRKSVLIQKMNSFKLFSHSVDV